MSAQDVIEHELGQPDHEDYGVGDGLECLTALGRDAKISPLMDGPSLSAQPS